MFELSKALRLTGVVLGFLGVSGCDGQPPFSPKASAAVTSSETNPELVGAWYQVYFDSDSSDVSPRSQMIILNVSTVVANNQATRVTVIGKSDSIGQLTENMALYQRRVDHVRQALIAAGVSDNLIDTRWIADSNLEVASVIGAAQQFSHVVDVLVVKQ